MIKLRKIKFRRSAIVALSKENKLKTLIEKILKHDLENKTKEDICAQFQIESHYGRQISELCEVVEEVIGENRKGFRLITKVLPRLECSEGEASRKRKKCVEEKTKNIY